MMSSSVFHGEEYNRRSQPGTSSRNASWTPTTCPESIQNTSEIRRSQFLLPFGTKLMLFLIFFAAIVSLSRTCTMLRLYTVHEGIRSLTIEQTRLRNVMPSKNNTYRRVTYLVQVKDWNSSIYSRTFFQNSSFSSSMDVGNSFAYSTKDVDSSDSPAIERPYWPQHEFDPHCQPATPWQSTFYPTCNDIHTSVDIRQAFVDGEFSLLSRKGYWRLTWLHENNSSRTTAPALKIVWKTHKFSHQYEELFYENSRVDAIAMERLSSSPYVINIYGFCGLTALQEYGCKDLSQVLAHDVVTSVSKLKLAKQIAEGVHHIHSIPDDNVHNIQAKYDSKNLSQVTLVHNDINLANVLFTAENRPIINDFNIAKLLMRHNVTGDTCPFYSQFPNPQWKAPEEQILYDEDGSSHHGTTPPIVNEKVDIYALGNIFFRILTGRSPWRRPKQDRLDIKDKVQVAQLKKYNGTIPPISNETIDLALRDPATHALLEAMKLCFRFLPSERPTAAELVHYLDAALTDEAIYKNSATHSQ